MNRRKIILLILLAVSLTSAVLAVVKYRGLQLQQQESQQVNRELQELITSPAPTNETSPVPTAAPSAKPTATASPTPTLVPDDTHWPKVDFPELLDLNPDVVGWIHIENTNISYPILHGEDNQYYLNHLITGEENREGSIYLDYRNDGSFEERNNVIYGHHLLVGTMFSELFAFKDEEFFEENDTILLMTPDENYKVKVMAVRIADLNDGSWDVFFDSDQEFLSWVSYRRNNALYTRDVEITAESRIVTLSTCSYEFDDARLVIVGVIDE